VTRAKRDESGAALVLAIVFMVAIGAIAGATLSLITSGINNRASLDVLRDREYAADGAIESAITQVRVLPAPGPALTGCDPGTHSNHTLSGINIRVNCTNVPTRTFSGYLQRNVIFTACLETSADCTDANSIVRAQVNFQAVGLGATTTVTRTWVQSWSVN
jgi:hypothetical protein